MTEEKKEDKLGPEHFLFVTLEEATKPVNGLFQIFVDYWWPLDSQGRIAFYNPMLAGKRRHASIKYRGSPQCNSNRLIAERVSQCQEWPVEIRQIPVVYVPIDPKDYVF